MVQEVGQISHVAASGRIVIRLNDRVDEGQVLCDKAGTRIATVMELVGAVDRPHASAAPLSDRLRKLEGRRVFAFPQRTARKKPGRTK